jgi:hypothetical protein
MSASVSNTTQEMCVICYEDYQGKEISNVNKVVELACHHFYHIGCISESLIYQENGQRKLSCCYCTQEVAPSARAANAFANQEVFQARLEEIKEDYDYDNEVMESVSFVADLCNQLHDLSNSFPTQSNDAIANQENGKKLTNAIGELVIENKTIKEDLKSTVLQVLAAMITGDRALRSVDDEAKRWRSVPFENWPEKIKEKGVLVRYEYEGTRMRIPANHLKKRVDKIVVDALVSHYQQKAKDFSQSVRFWAPKVLGVVVVATLVKKALDRL